MKYKQNSNVGEPKSNDDSPKDGGDAPPSVQLDIVELPQRYGGAESGGSGGGGGSGSFFEPHFEPTPGRGSVSGSGHGVRSGGGYELPEKRLTLFALRLAVMEKAASGLGKLAFVWATVVLLGGFASTLRLIDFWSVTVILVGEGARIFSRSHELEWQRHATSTSTAGGALRSSSRFFRRIVRAIVNPASALTEKHDDRAVSALDSDKAAQFQNKIIAYAKLRVWHAPDVSLLPYSGWVFISKNISRAFHWLQVLSALACVALSVMRLWKHDYGEVKDETRNRRPALVLFYSLAVAEAVLFLLEKAYWRWKVSYRKLLDQVSKDCALGVYGHVSLKRFFYDAYSQCISNSIFDGIKMDLVTFAEELILSDFLDEQLIGVRILRQFAVSESSAPDTLRKVGTSQRSIERLVEMLNWKGLQEEEVRRCAAEVVSKLAGKSQNALRVAGIPGSIESVVSLLYAGRGAPVEATSPHEASSAAAPVYDYLDFNLLGLVILKKLARDHDNCGKIGQARGLLPRIIEFTHASPALLRSHVAPDSQIRAVKRALQVIKMLVTTTGNTGKTLRREISQIVFTASNLRGILQHGQQHRELQKLAIDILTGLAVDEKAKEGIASTGGVVKLLLSIFFNVELAYANELSVEAGEALAMLALESKANCALILKREAALDRLITALDDDVARLNATRILRNLCAYSELEEESAKARLRGVTAAMPAVLKATMSDEKDEKLLEASIGLTTQIGKFIDCERFTTELQRADIKKAAYVQRLVSILKQYKYPEIKVPRMRRFVVLQAIWLMTSQCDYIKLFRELEMEKLLESIADTTSDLECFHVFSGSVGLSQHRKSLSDIVESALDLLHGSNDAEMKSGTFEAIGEDMI